MNDIMKTKKLMELTVEVLGNMSEEIIRIDEEIQTHSKEIEVLKENDTTLDSRMKRLERARFIDLRN